MMNGRYLLSDGMCIYKGSETSEKEHYRIILDLIQAKNPETMEKTRRDNDMDCSWMEILKPDLKETEKNNLFRVGQEGGMNFRHFLMASI